MTQDPLRVRRADISVQAWDGVTERLQKLYGVRSELNGNSPIPVIAVPDLALAERALQQKNANQGMPYIAVAPGNVDENTSGYNGTMMRKNGFVSRISDDRTTWTVLSLIPTTITYQVMLVTDDLPTLLRMIDRWVANQLWSFYLEQDDYRIRIRVVADKSFAVPPRTADAGGTDQFRQTGSLRVDSYSGYIYDIPSILTTELDLDLSSAQSFSDGIARAETSDLVLTKSFTASAREPAI